MSPRTVTLDPDNEAQVELVAAVAYSFTFHSREAGQDWQRLNAQAEAGGGYAGVLVERCLSQARTTLAALVRHEEERRASDLTTHGIT